MKLVAASLILLAACSGDDGPSGTPITYTGAYEDWDSTDDAFLGVFEATVTEVGDDANTTTTAPNGRSTLELPGGVVSEVTWTHADYVPARATVDAEASGAYALRGISDARVDTFHEELGVAYDDGATLVLIEVRQATGGGPFDGIAVDVDGADGFHDDADHVWQTGDTTEGGRYVVFPNVAPAADVPLAFSGATCTGPASITAVAGEVAMATVYCE